MQQIVSKFNVGSLEVCVTLEAKSEIRIQWLNRSNDFMKWKLGKAGNVYSNEGMYRSGLCVREAGNLK
jgi:hypothetical protein